MTALSPQQVQELKREGYSEYEIQEALNEIDNEEKLKGQYSQAKNFSGMSSTGKTTAFQYNPNDNLIKFQLELNEILDRTEHILRGDIVGIDSKGNQEWQPNPKPKDNPLNDYGVQEFMRILSMYLTRNTILGNYTAEEVDDIVFDFGKELNDLYFMKYEDLGMDTVYKRQNYPMFFLMMKHTVQNAYSRAIGGQERASLREARQMMQTETIQPQGTNINVNAMPQQKTRSFLNPARYVLGKYK